MKFSRENQKRVECIDVNN